MDSSYVMLQKTKEMNAELRGSSHRFQAPVRKVLESEDLREVSKLWGQMVCDLSLIKDSTRYNYSDHL